MKEFMLCVAKCTNLARMQNQFINQSYKYHKQLIISMIINKRRNISFHVSKLFKNSKKLQKSSVSSTLFSLYNTDIVAK